MREKALEWRGRLGRGNYQVSTPQPFSPRVCMSVAAEISEVTSALGEGLGELTGLKESREQPNRPLAGNPACSADPRRDRTLNYAPIPRGFNSL